MTTMTKQFRKHRATLASYLTEAYEEYGHDLEVECDVISGYIAAHVEGGESSPLAQQLRKTFGVDE